MPVVDLLCPDLSLVRLTAAACRRELLPIHGPCACQPPRSCVLSSRAPAHAMCGCDIGDAGGIRPARGELGGGADDWLSAFGLLPQPDGGGSDSVGLGAALPQPEDAATFAPCGAGLRPLLCGGSVGLGSADGFPAARIDETEAPLSAAAAGPLAAAGASAAARASPAPRIFSSCLSAAFSLAPSVRSRLAFDLLRASSRAAAVTRLAPVAPSAREIFHLSTLIAWKCSRSIAAISVHRDAISASARSA